MSDAETAGIVHTDRRYLNKIQRDRIHSEIDSAEGSLHHPEPHLRPPISSDVRKQINALKSDLAHGSPPELKGVDLDRASTRERQLRGEIQEGLLSGEEMRKNPAGAVGRYQRAEGGALKPKIMEWKNLRETLEPDSEDPDKSNIEILRPHQRRADPNMHGAQIEGQSFSFPSDAFMQGHDQIDWHAHAERADDELKASQERNEALEAELSALRNGNEEESKPIKRELSQEARQKMRAAGYKGKQRELMNKARRQAEESQDAEEE